jgi:hypothetical protein
MSGIEAYMAARAMSAPIISCLRFTRSTQAPITRPKSAYGRYTTAVVTASSRAEPVSSNTSRGSANALIALPKLEIV